MYLEAFKYFLLDFIRQIKLMKLDSCRMLFLERNNIKSIYQIRIWRVCKETKYVAYAAFLSPSAAPFHASPNVSVPRATVSIRGFFRGRPLHDRYGRSLQRQDSFLVCYSLKCTGVGNLLAIIRDWVSQTTAGFHSPSFSTRTNWAISVNIQRTWRVARSQSFTGIAAQVARLP